MYVINCFLNEKEPGIKLSFPSQEILWTPTFVVVTDSKLLRALLQPSAGGRVRLMACILPLRICETTVSGIIVNSAAVLTVTLIFLDFLG